MPQLLTQEKDMVEDLFMRCYGKKVGTSALPVQFAWSFYFWKRVGQAIDWAAFGLVSLDGQYRVCEMENPASLRADWVTYVKEKQARAEISLKKKVPFPVLAAAVASPTAVVASPGFADRGSRRKSGQATASHGQAGFVSDASPVQLTQLTTAASDSAASGPKHEARFLQALREEEKAREAVNAATEKFSAGQQAGLSGPQLAMLECSMDLAVVLWEHKSKAISMLPEVLGVLNLKEEPTACVRHQPALVSEPSKAHTLLDKKPAGDMHAMGPTDVSVEDGSVGDSEDINPLGDRAEVDEENPEEDPNITLSPSLQTPVYTDKHDAAGKGGKMKPGCMEDWNMVEEHGPSHLQEGGAQAYSVFCNTDMPDTDDEGNEGVAASPQQPPLNSPTSRMPLLDILTDGTSVHVKDTVLQTGGFGSVLDDKKHASAGGGSEPVTGQQPPAAAQDLVSEQVCYDAHPLVIIEHVEEEMHEGDAEENTSSDESCGKGQEIEVAEEIPPVVVEEIHPDVVEEIPPVVVEEIPPVVVEEIPPVVVEEQFAGGVEAIPQGSLHSEVTKSGGTGKPIVVEESSSDEEIAEVSQASSPAPKPLSITAAAVVDAMEVVFGAPKTKKRARASLTKVAADPVVPSPTKESLRSAGPAANPEGLSLKSRPGKRQVKHAMPYTPPENKKGRKSSKHVESEESPDPGCVAKKLSINELSGKGKKINTSSRGSIPVLDHELTQGTCDMQRPFFMEECQLWPILKLVLVAVCFFGSAVQRSLS